MKKLLNLNSKLDLLLIFLSLFLLTGCPPIDTPPADVPTSDADALQKVITISSGTLTTGT